MINDNMDPIRPNPELPKDVTGMRFLISGLKGLNADSDTRQYEGIESIRDGIGAIACTPDERNALRQEFDDKLAELFMEQIGMVLSKRELQEQGMTDIDLGNMRTAITAMIDHDIPHLPFFHRARRADLVIKTRQQMWAKGLIQQPE